VGVLETTNRYFNKVDCKWGGGIVDILGQYGIF
jgi:hypothetical protein